MKKFSIRKSSKSKGRLTEDGIVSETVGRCIALGMCFGVAGGTLLDTVGVGISLGICFGAAIGSVIGEKKKQKMADNKPKKTNI